MKDRQKKTYNKLLILFSLNVAAVCIIMLLTLFIVGPGLNNGQNVVFEQYSIIVTLAGIPVALKMFHSRYNKIKGLDETIYLEKYFNIYMLRLAILDAVIIINLAGLYAFKSQNAVYMIIITIVALFFCFPGKKVLDNNHNIEENLNNE